VAIELYDPNLTRAELMEPKPVEKPWLARPCWTSNRQASPVVPIQPAESPPKICA